MDRTEELDAVDLERFLLDMQHAFIALDMEHLERHCALPLVVYSAAGVVVLSDREEFESLTRRFHDLLSPEGIVDIECDITDLSEPKNSRFHTTVRWRKRDAGGCIVMQSALRYFIATGGPDWQIEMIEYIELPVDLSAATRLLH